MSRKSTLKTTSGCCVRNILHSSPLRCKPPAGPAGSDQNADVAAAVLGLVERSVGPAEKRRRVLLAVPAGNADRAGLTLRRGGAHALCHLDRALGRAARQRQGELLAAVAGEEVGAAQLHAPCRGRLLEETVAGLVAALVVELLEVVQVDHRDAQRAVLALGAQELARQLLLPGAAVGQAGE